MRELHSLGRDRHASTIVEFALLSPVMLLMICGLLELGHLFFAQVALQGAVTEAARASSATLESGDDQRDEAMRTRIGTIMQSFPLEHDKALTVTTNVYANFSDSYPENFTDLNKNGVYDPPSGSFGGEPFVDRNGNGKWDPALPKSDGGKLGGPGDVVSYTAVFPAALLFDSLLKPIGVSGGVTLRATTVVRNEAFQQKSAT